MPLEDIWREFFSWGGGADGNKTDLYSIYIHPSPKYRYPSTSLFHDKEISPVIATSRGTISIVYAMRNLVRAALKDSTNAWFCLISESCIPLVPLSKWRRVMLRNNKSLVNACPYSPNEMGLERRWRTSLDEVGLLRSEWRKSANWFAITRKHAELFAADEELVAAFSGIGCVDEHYLPILLAHHKLENETTCTDGLVHVNWRDNYLSHPKTYLASDIREELFPKLQTATYEGRGFSRECSGFEGLCHFTARKFAASTKHPILENLSWILNDPELKLRYTGNPWKQTTVNTLLSVTAVN